MPLSPHIVLPRWWWEDHLFLLVTSLMSLDNVPYMSHRQLPHRISIFPTRQSYVFLKPKANATLCTASGLLFVSNIKRSRFHARNSRLFPPFSAQQRFCHTTCRNHLWWYLDLQAILPRLRSPPLASCQPVTLMSKALRLHCSVLLVSYHYGSKSFISEANNYSPGYVEGRKLVCTWRNNEGAIRSAVLLLHWFLEVERNG